MRGVVKKEMSRRSGIDEGGDRDGKEKVTATKTLLLLFLLPDFAQSDRYSKHKLTHTTHAYDTQPSQHSTHTFAILCVPSSLSLAVSVARYRFARCRFASLASLGVFKST